MRRAHIPCYSYGDSNSINTVLFNSFIYLYRINRRHFWFTSVSLLYSTMYVQISVLKIKKKKIEMPYPLESLPYALAQNLNKSA